MKNRFRAIFPAIVFCLYINVSAQERDYWPVDGWLQKEPSEVGMNSEWLELMQNKIENSMLYVDAFLVVKDGYLVFEKYYNNFNAEKYHILCSSTKSITSIIIGMLLKKGILDSVGEKIMGYFPEYDTVNSDARLNDLTIEHMLTFTPGLTNNNDNSVPESDMIEFFLSQPFFADPGAQFKYSTPASQILSALVNKKTDINARQFAEEHLFPVLGIGNHHWPADPQNYTFGGYNSYFCPRDMLKFGFLYLNNGIWNGDTLIDPAYVATSTVVHNNGGNPHKEKYGYNWWITENNGYHAYFAGGYGGQFIYVVPELDLVAAITCRTDKHREDARFLVNDYIVPAILNHTTSEDILHKTLPQVEIYPNPVSGDLTIELEITEYSDLSLYIYDLYGRTVASICDNKNIMPGKKSFIWQPDVAPGNYHVKVGVGEKVIIKKLIVAGEKY